MRPGADKCEGQKHSPSLTWSLHFPPSSFSSLHLHTHTQTHTHTHTHTSLIPLTKQHAGEKPRKDFKEGRELISPSLGQNFNLQANKSSPNVNRKANVVYFLTAFYLFDCCVFLLENFPLIKPLIHQWYFLIYNRLTELMLLTLDLFSFSFFFLSFFFFFLSFAFQVMLTCSAWTVSHLFLMSV